MKTFFIILSNIFTIAIQVLGIVIMFFAQESAISTLNEGGVMTLLSLFLIAPIFILPLILCIITSFTLLIISIVKRETWLIITQLIIFGFSIYFAISFFTQVSIS